ncbi:MAG: family 16 glycoside hydrolase, partial [Planctomycetota bacterium]
EDGVLVNKPIQQKGKRHISYGNLRTVEEFEDFNLKLQVNVPRRGNSGIYLRGIYEVQVSDA